MRKRTGRSVRGVALGLTLAMVIVACQSATPETTTTVTTAPGQETTTTGAPSEPTSITIGVEADVSTIDLALEAAFHEILILDNVFDSFTQRLPDGSVVPALVETWEASGGGQVWTLNLRQGVLFHSGDEMTSADVQASIERHLEIGRHHLATYDGLTTIETPDDYTVVLTFDSPKPMFMQATPMFTPVINRRVLDEFGEAVGSTVESIEGAGTGAYMVTEWSRDDRIVMAAFEDYWQGRPAIDEVIFRIIPNASARTAALLAQEADIVTPFPVEQAEIVDAHPAAEIRSVSGLNRVRIILNTNVAPFDDVLVRQAINHAINRADIIDNLLAGFAVETATFAVPAEVGFNPDLVPYEYNPGRARDLLAQAGYPNGFTVDFPVRLAFPLAEEVGQVLVAQLAEVGITANMRTLPSGDFQDLAREKSIDMGVSTFNGGGRFHVGGGFDLVFLCSAATLINGGFYCNEALDEVVDEARALDLTDPEAAVGKYREAVALCFEDACEVSMWSNLTAYGVANRVIWDPHPSGTLNMYRASVTGD